MWACVKATQLNRVTLMPPHPTDLWEDLNQAYLQLHVQSLELGDLREAINFLAEIIQGLKNRLEIQEKGTLE